MHNFIIACVFAESCLDWRMRKTKKKSGILTGIVKSLRRIKNEDLKIMKLCTTSHMGKDNGEVLALFQN